MSASPICRIKSSKGLCLSKTMFLLSWQSNGFLYPCNFTVLYFRSSNHVFDMLLVKKGQILVVYPDVLFQWQSFHCFFLPAFSWVHLSGVLTCGCVLGSWSFYCAYTCGFPFVLLCHVLLFACRFYVLLTPPLTCYTSSPDVFLLFLIGLPIICLLLISI